MIHWADEHSRYVRDRFPELGGGPVYIRTIDEVALNIRMPEARAFTGLCLDLSIRDELASRGEWQGRGFTCIIGQPGEFFRAAWPDQIGLILHELSHHLVNRPRVLDEDERMVAGGPKIEPRHYLNEAGEYRQEFMRGVHGPEFVRAGLHAFHRCRWDVPLSSINLFWDRYESPPATEALTALDSELRTGGDILDIMQTAMPEPFAKLWQ